MTQEAEKFRKADVMRESDENQDGVFDLNRNDRLTGFLPRFQAPAWERNGGEALPHTTGGAGRAVGSQAGAWEQETRILLRFRASLED